jgi:hypothetical protein
MGMIYKRGEVFWIKYYSGGKPIRESTKDDQAEKGGAVSKEPRRPQRGSPSAAPSCGPHHV